MKNDTQDKKVSQNRQKKETLVAELTEKVKKSTSLVFTNYQGLTHQQLEKLKKAVKKLDAEFVATKNTLILLTLKGKVDAEKEKDNFTQPTATLFIYKDMIGPLKELTSVIKEFGLPKIKFGIIEGSVVTENEVKRIADLPPLPVLQAQLLGQMKAPISGLHRALNWNLQKLVMTLSEIEKKKQAAA